MLQTARTLNGLNDINPFQWAPTLGGECYSSTPTSARRAQLFQWAPTLGGECYASSATSGELCSCAGFNGHPPLGVNATYSIIESSPNKEPKFQWAPTLGGECYYGLPIQKAFLLWEFQWAPTLGGECYWDAPMLLHAPQRFCFNGHPPLGVNATV